MRTHTYAHVHTCIYHSIHIHILMNTYVHVRTNTYIHKYTYIYICTHAITPERTVLRRLSKTPNVTARSSALLLGARQSTTFSTSNNRTSSYLLSETPIPLATSPVPNISQNSSQNAQVQFLFLQHFMSFLSQACGWLENITSVGMAGTASKCDEKRRSLVQ